MNAFLWFLLGSFAALSPCFLVIGLLVLRSKEGDPS